MFVDMGMGKLTQAKDGAIGCLDPPGIGIVVPAGVGVGQGDIEPPAVAITRGNCPGHLRFVRKGRAGGKDREKG